MPYRPLDVRPRTPLDLERKVRERLDPFLRDVHSMLCLPRTEIAGLEGGCNFSATLVLLGVVSGVSVGLYHNPQPDGFDDRDKSGKAFKQVLDEHYPWGGERTLDGAICDRHAAEILYKAFRNPLTHSLGVDEETSHGPAQDREGATVGRRG